MNATAAIDDDTRVEGSVPSLGPEPGEAMPAHPPAAPDTDPRTPRGLLAYEPKVRAAWNVLSDRYGSSLSRIEIDYLQACFVVGLTRPEFGAAAPEIHLEACRGLLALVLPPERAEAALHYAPAPAEEWMETAFVTVEGHGERAGREIVNGHREAAAADGGGAEH